MTDRNELSEPAALVALARDLLRGGLLEALPETRRYEVRLIANALSIAARELGAGSATLEDEAARLKDLFGETARPAHAAPPAERADQTVERLRWRLAAEIRGGLRDGNPATHAMLSESLDARLRLVNPKALEESNGIGRRSNQ